MEILGYVIVKCIMGYELRASRHNPDQFVYRSSTMDAVLGYLRMNGYPEPPLEIPFIIESY
jgi:hypothetical protein